jgi:hypothetical protein
MLPTSFIPWFLDHVYSEPRPWPVGEEEFLAFVGAVLEGNGVTVVRRGMCFDATVRPWGENRRLGLPNPSYASYLPFLEISLPGVDPVWVGSRGSVTEEDFDQHEVEFIASLETNREEEVEVEVERSLDANHPHSDMWMVLLPPTRPELEQWKAGFEQHLFLWQFGTSPLPAAPKSPRL